MCVNSEKCRSLILNTWKKFDWYHFLIGNGWIWPKKWQNCIKHDSLLIHLDIFSISSRTTPRGDWFHPFSSIKLFQQHSRISFNSSSTSTSGSKSASWFRLVIFFQTANQGPLKQSSWPISVWLDPHHHLWYFFPHQVIPCRVKKFKNSSKYIIKKK